MGKEPFNNGNKPAPASISTSSAQENPMSSTGKGIGAEAGLVEEFVMGSRGARGVDSLTMGSEGASVGVAAMHESGDTSGRVRESEARTDAKDFAGVVLLGRSCATCFFVKRIERVGFFLGGNARRAGSAERGRFAGFIAAAEVTLVVGVGIGMVDDVCRPRGRCLRGPVEGGVRPFEACE